MNTVKGSILKPLYPMIVAQTGLRASFYTLNPIIVLHFISALCKPSDVAATVLNYCKLGCYLGPFIAYTLEKIAGYRVALAFSTLIMLGGQIIMMTSLNNFSMMTISYACLALGTGLLYPLMPIYFNRVLENDALKSKLAFSFQYWATNLLCLVVCCIVPIVYTYFSPWAGFLVPFLICVISFILSVPQLIFKDRHIRSNFSCKIESLCEVNIEKAVLPVLRKLYKHRYFLITIIIYFILHEQMFFAFVIHTKRMDLNILGYAIAPSNFLFLDPLVVILFVPIYTAKIMPYFKERYSSGNIRLVIGMAVLPLNYLIILLYEILIHHNVNLPIMLDSIIYILIAVNEVFINIEGVYIVTQHIFPKQETLGMMIYLLCGIIALLVINFIVRLFPAIERDYFGALLMLSLFGVISAYLAHKKLAARLQL